MEPAPIQILSRAAFDLMPLSAGRDWIVSIREEEDIESKATRF